MKERRFRILTANFVIIAVLGIVLGTTAAVLITTPASGAVPTGSAIYSGDPDSGSISLMVNVYEGTEYVEQIATLLKARGFTTTFFVGGKWVEKNPDALLRLYADGFEIGNHGYLHRDHAKLSKKQNRDEILVTEKLLGTILSGFVSDTPYSPSKLFAPPSGSIGTTMFETCEELGYKVIMWTRDTIDWRDHDEDLIYTRAIRGIKSGDLILMHPTECTVKALPRILDCIEAESLRVDTVTNTLKK